MVGWCGVGWKQLCMGQPTYTLCNCAGEPPFSALGTCTQSYKGSMLWTLPLAGSHGRPGQHPHHQHRRRQREKAVPCLLSSFSLRPLSAPPPFCPHSWLGTVFSACRTATHPIQFSEQRAIQSCSARLVPTSTHIATHARIQKQTNREEEERWHHGARREGGDIYQAASRVDTLGQTACL